jgi:chemotaxis regulatin CheY-phosphate phosphatase CheZ
MSENPKLQAKLQKEIGELAASITELVKNFRELNNPLTESREKVPVATQQLDKITEQTEAATHQMLDTVEQILSRQEEVIDGLAKVKEYMDGQDNAELSEVVDSLVEKSNTTLNDTYTIMDALQFQDITSQQINHAASLLEDIEGKLSRMMGVMGGGENDSEEAADGSGESPRTRVFDPNADIYEKKTDQAAVDDLISQNSARK